MAIFHCSIKLIGRKDGRDAVASAAYRAGERLYDEEYQEAHDYTRKQGVVMREILLPENAPERLKNREVLWNEVQKIESQKNAQFAREIEVAFPVEMTREEQISCVHEYVQTNFVSKGMIVDLAIHDKGNGNPHVHIMLPLRGFDEDKNWMQKKKTVFANDRDEKGRAIFNPEKPSYDPKNKESTKQYRIPVLDENGEQKVRARKGKGKELLWERITISMNDWSNLNRAEVWRASWAECCNKYLDEEHKIDHRSYARQGVEKIPTIHEGPYARKMEKEGQISDRCNENRKIKKANSRLEKIRELVQTVMKKAGDLYERYRRISRNYESVGRQRGDHLDNGNTRSYHRRIGAGIKRDKGELSRIQESKSFTSFTDRVIAATEQDIARAARGIVQVREWLEKGKEHRHVRRR